MNEKWLKDLSKKIRRGNGAIETIFDVVSKTPKPLTKKEILFVVNQVVSCEKPTVDRQLSGQDLKINEKLYDMKIEVNNETRPYTFIAKRKRL